MVNYNYTDDEIEATLREMGLQLPNRSYFDDLRTNVNNRVQDSEVFEITNDNLAEYLRRLELGAQHKHYYHQPWGRATMDVAEACMAKAEDALLESADRMAQLENKILNFVFDDPTSLSSDKDESKPMEPELSLSPTPYRLSVDGSTENKENEEFQLPRQIFRKPRQPPKRFQPPNPEQERQKINEFLRKNCLRRVHKPETGRLPYQVDRLALLKRYREEWAKHPHPGEAKRTTLRNRIRRWMMTRDIPVMKLANQQTLDMTRPDWVD